MVSIFQIVCILLIATLVLYVAIYKATQKLPGPVPLPFVGNVNIMFPDMGRNLIAWHKKYGDIYQIYLGTTRIVIVGNPEFVQENLLKPSSEALFKRIFGDSHGAKRAGIYNTAIVSNDDFQSWRKNRKIFSRVLMDPIFLKSVSKSMEQTVLPNFNRRLNAIISQSHGDAILKPLFQEAQVDAQLRLLFGEGIDSMSAGQLVRDFEEALLWVIMTPEVILKYCMPSRYERCMKYVANMYQFITELVERKIGQFEDMSATDRAESTNFIIKLLNMSDVNSAGNNTEGGKLPKTEEERLTKTDVIALCRDVLMGAISTTTNTLAAAAYHLARNPDVQEKLHSELVLHIEKFGFPTPTTLNEKSMPYLNAVTLEVLRKASGFPIVVRCCGAAIKLGPVELAPSEGLFVTSNYVHENPNFWEKPGDFIPERFLEDEKKKQLLMAWGFGIRKCAGQSLGELAVKLGICNLILGYKLSPPRQLKDEPWRVDFITVSSIPEACTAVHVEQR